MVEVEEIVELKPSLPDEFHPGEFVARTDAIAEAYRWGSELHRGQKRLNGEPYFETHCAWVGMFIDRLVCNEAWTIAALLHDSVEDSGETLERIREHFPGPLGEEVAHIVDGVTKISHPRDGRSRELATLQKIARFRDPAVYLVKLADKSHNLLTLQHMPPEKRVKKATEAIRAYGKLAGILNCYRWRRWLEDTAFPHAEPETFAFVRSRIDSDPRLNVDFLNSIMRQLGRLMEETGIPGRVELTINGYWQTWQKLRRMALQRRSSMHDFSMVNDLVSFRLIVEEENVAQCYVLLGAVNRFFSAYLDDNRFDDYIASPQNGYRALQVTAYLPELGAVEFAIATREMEGENTWGVVYAIKNNKDLSLYQPVQILTPTGGARFVQEGSTVLDAVAAIQQERLLDKISAVKVNGSLARLSDKIQPGSVVEVITGQKRLVPNPDWLNFANPTTRRTLRSVLATEALRAAAEKGRREIREVLIDMGLVALEDVQVLLHDEFDTLLEMAGAASLDDLYAAYGDGAVRREDLVKALEESGIAGITREWTSVFLMGSAEANRPGVLVQLAGLVSRLGGNILRSVNNTMAGGEFTLRLVVRGLDEEGKAQLREAFRTSGLALGTIEVW